jgi:hypothetical protein
VGQAAGLPKLWQAGGLPHEEQIVPYFLISR